MAAHQARYGRRGVRSARLLSSATQVERKRIRSSPHSQNNSNWLVVNSCVSAPVCGSRLRETEVRVLEWRSLPGRAIGLVGRFVFMPCSLPKQHKKTYSNKLEELL